MKREIMGLIAVIIAVFLIIIAACSNNVTTEPSPPPSSAQPSMQPSQAAGSRPPDATYTVKTDYSHLTPFEPPEEIYTRLSKDFMPALVPSDDYGLLLPYVGQVLYADPDSFEAGSSFQKYGLVTRTGMIVTDAVYGSINQGVYFDLQTGSYMEQPVYILEGTACGVCALDGSWATPMEYSAVFDCDETLLLIRDVRTYDIDVMDYSGNILYNMKNIGLPDDLKDYAFDPMAGLFGEGYLALPREDDTLVYINQKTGAVTLTSYADGNNPAVLFSDGAAAVLVDGLWGYMDKSFSMIIKPAFTEADSFINGKAIVKTTDGRQAVIDKTGTVLIASLDITYNKGLYYISGRYYDAALNKVYPDAGGSILAYVNDGWWYYRKSGGVKLISRTAEYFYPDIGNIYEVAGNYIEYLAKGGEGIMTLDGRDVIPMSQAQPAVVNIAATGAVFFVVNDIHKNTFSVLDEAGNTVITGAGRLRYDERYNLFRAEDDDYFGYMDTSGKFVFRISLLDCIPD